jgi:hypothetical protein
MKIHITMRMTIAELQQAFSEYFPNLSLSFFSKPHEIFQSSPVKYLFTEYNLPLERIEGHPHDGDIEIFPDMTVADLEHLFEREFGLHIQVLRKEGRFWVETAFTDNLSLCAQNEMATVSKGENSSPNVNYHDARTEWYLG